MAISVDRPEETQPLVERLGLRFPVLSDAELAVAASYGVVDTENEMAWPAVFAVGRDGKVVWRSLSQTYKTRPTPAEILAALGTGPAKEPGTP